MFGVSFDVGRWMFDVGRSSFSCDCERLQNNLALILACSCQPHNQIIPMKINTIINRYVFLQMLSPFAVSILFFTFVFLMTEILDITNMVVNYSIGIDTVLLLFLYVMPRFMELIIPISVMTAVLVTFIRLSGDNEIIACKACGISISEIIPPVLLFSLTGCIITAFVTIYCVPWSRVSYKQMTQEITSSYLNTGFKERRFNDKFKNVMLYVNKVEHKKNELIDVFIEDQRNPEAASTVIAARGVFSCDMENYLFLLRLYNGSINQVNLEKKRINSINFETYDIKFDLKETLGKAKAQHLKKKEMSLKELRHEIRAATIKNSDYYQALIEFHKKFSIPFACVALGLIAMPLGINTGSFKKTFGLGAGLFFLLVYYMLLSAGFVFGETGFYPPVIGMWLTNIVIGGTGLFLLIKTSKEQDIYILKFIRQKIKIG